MAERTGTGMYEISSGWICEVATGCTCGDGVYAHEPGCGLIPIVPVGEALEAASMTAKAKIWAAGALTAWSQSNWVANGRTRAVPKRVRFANPHLIEKERRRG